MKYLAFIILINLNSALYGQVRRDTTKIKVSETFYATPDKFYVDSVETEISKIYLDPNNIKEVMTFKDNEGSLDYSRVVYLLTRKEKVEYLTLADLYSKLNIHDSLPVKFFVDGEFLEDTSGVRFEPLVIKKIKVKRNKSYKDGDNDERIINVLITTQWRRKSKPQ